MGGRTALGRGLGLAGLVLASLLTLSPAKALAELEGESFTSDDWRVEVRGPKGWQLSDRATYPSVLLWMVHRQPVARMLFSAEYIDDNVKSSRDYAEQTAAHLKKMGFDVRNPQQHGATGAFWIDFDNGKQFLRQALLVPSQSSIGYSLTMSAPEARTRSQFLRAFDETLRSVRPMRDEPAEETSPSPDAGVPDTGVSVPENGDSGPAS